MKCKHDLVAPGMWFCQGCKHKAISSHAPDRECGQAGSKRSAATIAKANTPPPSGTCRHLGPLARQQVCKPCQASGQSPVDVFQCSIHRECTRNSTSIHPRIQACSTCPDVLPLVPLIPSLPSNKPPHHQQTIPIRSLPQPWRGSPARKPWEYDITAVIPILEPDRSLTLILELLRLQTERPYILLIDTGSNPETTAWVNTLRADDLEVHLLRMNAVCHPSEPVSIALDTALARRQSRFVFYTHSDCFLTRRTALEELKQLATTHIVAGHQISPRPYTGWETEVGHTLLMVDHDALQITWSMRDAMRADGRPDFWPDYNRGPHTPNYPDTETNFNRQLKSLGITPHITGAEANYRRNVDGWIDHVRSHAGSKVYSQEYHAQASQWLPNAIQEAQQRISEWRKTK